MLAIRTEADDVATARRRLLIVEDDADFAGSLQDFLEPRGFDIRVANSAQQAMAITLSFTPDFVVLDVNLAKDSGLGLVEVLKSVHRGVICLVMTAMEDRDLVVESVRVGADGFFRKPFDPNTLFEAMNGAHGKPRRF